ncbi:hypothetical protein T05_319 [Trichinella murrelli]|uniref:Uncharacterized protein n=1 Tax=Trichinella murrelli TaxID=144512 RepID=A0A0V0STF0_9BILA|nr:hypothetical protein T05_319 [Trichinella murrelli]
MRSCNLTWRHSSILSGATGSPERRLTAAKPNPRLARAVCLSETGERSHATPQ